ncbi:MAG: DNA polymerase I [bacterium]|nr:DNA polymerase I [bacterium]
MKKIVIIDGKSVFYRGYYAMAGLTTADGTPTGGVFGFASLAFEIIRKLNPDYVVVAWDKKGTSISRRLEIFDGYKAGRKTPPEDFQAQIPILHDFLQALGWPLFECDGYEADDILGTLSEQANAQGIESYLITSDLDMLQLIDQDTKVFAMKRGFSNIEEFDLAYFEEKYGLKQAQFLDLKALQGDSSDNIPGVPGIGPKTATALLQEFFTLEGIYENLEKIKPAWRKKLEEGRESAFMSKKLAEIWTDAPVTLDLAAADIHNFDYSAVLAAMKKLEFNSLVRKIPAEMRNAAKAQNQNQASLFSGDFAENNAELPELTKATAPEILNSKNLEKFEKPIFVDFENSIFTISDGEKSAELAASEFSDYADFWRNSKTIFYDSKSTFHAMAQNQIAPIFGEIYDLRQMAFLLNALIRDKTLRGISATAIDEEKPLERLKAMILVFEKQQKELRNLPKIRAVAEKLDFPLSKVLFKMERAGVQIKPEFFAEQSQIFGEKIAQLEAEIFELAGREFNVASPLQLSKILFEDLNLPTKGIKKSKNGFSTGQKELDKLRELHPIIAKIEEFREFSKLKNTYIDALPKLADAQNRIHSTFNQDVTTTGRLSSTNPNLQNIPIRSELGRKIREGFVARKGHILVAADYSQFELRLAAVLSGDQNLIEDFKSGADIHLKTAASMFNLPLEEISPSQRRAAKVINFGVLYGMSAHRLASELGTSFFEAQNFIENYFEIRKPIQNFISKTISQAENEGFVETLYGRRRPTPDVKSANFMVREAAKRAAANMPIQGTEADLMKRAMLIVDEKITQAGLGEQILQIHDSILIETPEEKAEEVAKILRETMENICPELVIPLKVDVKIGRNWELI